jgi:hypothetical protein
MNTEFVPYEQALALKELGFNEPCLGYYIELRNPVEGLLKIGLDNDYLQAPLCQQAFRWFRENHDLYINVTRYNDEGEDKFLYYIDSGDVEEEFSTYEEAELACLNKLIEIVKQKQ